MDLRGPRIKYLTAIAVQNKKLLEDLGKALRFKNEQGAEQIAELSRQIKAQTAVENENSRKRPKPLSSSDDSDSY